MAEIVGLITAIGTIVASGFKITRAIGAIHDDLGAATASIKAIAADTSFVTMVLGQIRDTISANRVTDSDTLKILGEIVSRCRTDIEEIESLVLPLLTNVKSGGSLSKRRRIRWLFAKSKICSQLAALGSLKLTLSLFIHTMQLSDGYNTE
ncbi:hypothetical protein N656DRAFT_368004 [Canariomyces notabilis]|uniref:Fungal N-terminal domain-containing protein n=1 Tax=Canariomyces notabilis TaxID=2074819 RepID=A0AAN6QIQ5_9PEZI|nr:hypothetical protein N656DRAFT_368004 [Canariomyces arenarius]